MDNPWRSTVLVLILNTSRVSMVYERGRGQWHFPTFRFVEQDPVPLLQQKLRDDILRNCFLLRCCSFQYGEKHDQKNAPVTMTYLLEDQQCNGNLPSNWHWIELNHIDHISLQEPRQWEIIREVLREEATHTYSWMRAPWEKRGWFPHVEKWIQMHLDSSGFVLNGPINYIKSWPMSCVLHIPTTSDVLYFKASPFLDAIETNSRFASIPNETALTQKLSLFFPTQMPIPLALDTHRRWMLLKGCTSSLQKKNTLSAWENAIHVYGGLQVRSISHVEKWLEEGCVDHRLIHLSQHIDFFLSELQQRESIPISTKRCIYQQVPYLRFLCSQLADSQIPPSLVHGDLHPGNIAYVNDQCIFLDWAAGCISHPFLDGAMFCSLASRLNDPTAKMKLQQTYLNAWVDYASQDILQKEFAQAEIIRYLHNAIGYFRALYVIENPWKRTMEDALSNCLVNLLQLLEERG